MRLASHWHFESSQAEKFVNIASPSKSVCVCCVMHGIVYWLGCSFVGLYYIECCWLEKSLNVEDHYGLIKSEIFLYWEPTRQWWKETSWSGFKDSIILLRWRRKAADVLLTREWRRWSRGFVNKKISPPRCAQLMKRFLQMHCWPSAHKAIIISGTFFTWKLAIIISKECVSAAGAHALLSHRFQLRAFV